MKALLLATLYTVLRSYAGAGLFDRVAAEVRRLTSTDLTGAEKMAAVLAFVEAEALNLGNTLVRAIVEVVLLKLKAV